MSKSSKTNGDSKKISKSGGGSGPPSGGPSPGPSRGRGGSLESGLSFDSGTEGGQLIRALNNSQVPEDIKKLLKSELNQDHILANLDEAELTWRRFGLLNNMEMVMASHPPKESIWQGDRRKEAGLGDGRSSLTPEQVHWIRDSFDAAYERATRSRDGWQQKLLSEQTQERRVVEEHEVDEGGSWLSKLVG
jgi:hypothetical protein